MITITEEALKHLSEMTQKANQSKCVTGIRFGVKAGGCSGFEYILEPMGLADEREDDFVLHLRGIRIHINAKSIPFVEETEIDHARSSGNLIGGFIFKNPNAKASCGCGTSFELKDEPKA